MGTRRVLVLGLALAGAFIASAMVVRAAGPFKGHAQLSGYQEVPTLSSPASGSFDVEISKDGNSLSYTLSYEGIATNVLFAHIHIGRPAVNGGVMVFLCTNAAPPAGVPVPPPCPQGGGSVSGSLTAADVLAVAASNVAANDFAAVVDALRAEAGYANVHSAANPGGQLRGQVLFSRADSIKDN
jgi:hypothetical protein